MKWAADFGKSANSSHLTNQVPGFQWNNKLTTMSCTATTTATSTSHPYNHATNQSDHQLLLLMDSTKVL
jgi:hypothetical protein